MLIKNEDGTEIEAYTAEEVEAQKAEAIEAALEQYKIDNPDKTAELEELQNTLKEKEEELAKLKEKDLNFSNLRKQKESAEKAVENIKAEIDAKIASAKKEVLEGVMKDHYDETLKSLSGGDEELKKKIEFHYKRLGDIVSTKTEMSNKLKDAHTLATRKDEPDITAILGSGGIGRLKMKGQNKGFTPEEQALGAKFGLTPEDYKKYGNLI